MSPDSVRCGCSLVGCALLILQCGKLLRACVGASAPEFFFTRVRRAFSVRLAFGAFGLQCFDSRGHGNFIPPLTGYAAVLLPAMRRAREWVRSKPLGFCLLKRISARLSLANPKARSGLDFFAIPFQDDKVEVRRWRAMHQNAYSVIFRCFHGDFSLSQNPASPAVGE